MPCAWVLKWVTDWINCVIPERLIISHRLLSICQAYFAGEWCFSVYQSKKLWFLNSLIESQRIGRFRMFWHRICLQGLSITVDCLDDSMRNLLFFRICNMVSLCLLSLTQHLCVCMRACMCVCAGVCVYIYIYSTGAQALHLWYICKKAWPWDGKLKPSEQGITNRKWKKIHNV